jgi:DNA-binding MltR family transcriptional regulator
MTDPDFDLSAYIQEKSRQSEPALALTTGAIIEDWLEEVIKSKMRVLSSALNHRLFTGYGPLASFSAKIDIGYVLLLFEEDIYNDLRAIKDIRNKFAHSKDYLHFNSDELGEHIRKLSGWTREADPQALFMARAHACVEVFKPHLETNALIQALRAYKPRTSPETSPSQRPDHPAALDESPKGEEGPPQSSGA